jgi:hypothetical protein
MPKVSQASDGKRNFLGAASMEPHICVVENRARDPRGEFVEVANFSARSLALTGLELTDYTGTQRRPHIYRFPKTTEGGVLALAPRRSAYVFTGHGRNERTEGGDLLLFWGLSHSVWNDAGDVAYLRRGDGTFVDTRTVGDPKRHPNGH